MVVSNKGARSSVLPEVLDPTNKVTGEVAGGVGDLIMSSARAVADSDLLAVELCRTSSTSSPAEGERSTALYIGEYTSWDT